MGDYNNQDNKTDNQSQPNNQNYSQAPQYQQPQYQSPQYQQPQQQQPQQQQPQYRQPQFQQAPYQQPAQPDYQYQQYQQYPNTAQKPSTGMAIASMILGIASVVTSCLWFLSIPAGIVGLVLGIICLKNKQDGKGMAIAGLILSGVGIVAALIVIISAIAFVNDVGNNWDSWYNDIYNDLY
jgi:hypothetical protein